MAGKRGVAKKWSVFTRISVTARSVMLPYVILAVICGVILLPWLWWRSVLAKAIPGVPFVPPAFLLGNISFFKKYGNVPGRIALWSSLGRPDNFIIWFGPKPILSVTKAEDIKATLNHSYPFRNSTGLMMNHWKRVFGDKSMIFLKDDEWRAHRAAMAQGFQFVDLKNMVTDFVAVGHRLLRFLDGAATSGDITNMVEVNKAATADVIGLAGFGYSMNALDGLAVGSLPSHMVAFNNLLLDFARRFYGSPLQALYWLPTAANKASDANRKTMSDLVNGIVAERKRVMKEEPDSPAAKREDILHHLLKARAEDTEGLITDATLTDALATVLGAGYETTATTLSIAIWLLHNSPAALAALRAEVDAVLPSDMLAEVTQDMVSRLPYTRAVFDETLRMYAPTNPMRTFTSPLTLSGGVVVPAGTDCQTDVCAVHYNPEYWPEPEVFKPERFYAPPGGEAPRILPGSYIPFSLGRRDCVGRSFSKMEGVTLMSMMYRHFDLVVEKGFQLDKRTIKQESIPVRVIRRRTADL